MSCIKSSYRNRYPEYLRKTIDFCLIYGIAMKIDEPVTKDRLIEILQSLLSTDIEFPFLLQLRKRDIETLVACIRERIDNIKK